MHDEIDKKYALLLTTLPLFFFNSIVNPKF